MIQRAYLQCEAVGQLHYARAGTGPVIILLHQTPRSWDEYREIIELLKGKFTLIAMDLPGMGASTAPKSQASIATYADAVIYLAEHLGIDHCTLCGHHTGGVVALAAASRRPDLFSSLILSSTPWIDRSEIERRAGKTPIDTVTRTSDGDHLTQLWNQRRPYYPAGTEFMDRFICDALKARSPDEGHRAVGKYDMETPAKKIECPVLIVEHAKDPFASKHTQSLIQAFPQATLHSIAEGHVPLEATAPEFAAIIERWTVGISQSPLSKAQA